MIDDFLRVYETVYIAKVASSCKYKLQIHVYLGIYPSTGAN